MTWGHDKSAKPTRQSASEKAAATDHTAWGIIAKEQAARQKKTEALRKLRLERSGGEAEESTPAKPGKSRSARARGG